MRKHLLWVVLLVVAAALSARADAPLFELTLSGPVTFDPGTPVEYSGRLTAAGIGLSGQVVELSVDDQWLASTATDEEGRFSFQHTFPAQGTHMLQAAAFRGLPIETRSRTVKAETATYELSVGILGAGRVISSPAAIDCPNVCRAVFPSGTAITLGAVPDEGWKFYSWGSACGVSTSQVCELVLRSNASATTRFGEVIDTPVLTSTVPASPAATTTTPKVLGTAEANSPITLFNGAGCFGASIGSGTASPEGTFQITATTGANTTTTISAVAYDAYGNRSECSNSLTYEHDAAPPAFGGATGVVGDSDAQVTVTWSAASDNRTPAESIVYEVCLAPRASRCVDSFSAVATVVGGTSHTFTGLVAEATYYAVVRASDELGNRESNSVAASGRTTGDYHVTAIGAGFKHSCALVSDGTVRCWGGNGLGELGDGTRLASLTPIVVVGIADAVALSTLGETSCALIADGTVRCWGAIHNWGRQNTATALPVEGLSGVTQVAAGELFACALLADTTVRCWGDDDVGQLGDGSTPHGDEPVAVEGLSGVASISAGVDHACALLIDGSARCWGANWSGQIGDGTMTTRVAPVAVSGLSGAVALEAGSGWTTCAVLLDGSARCWGENGNGALGDGTTIDQWTPVPVQDLSGVVDIRPGGPHTCARMLDRTVRCWGYNAYGQVGDGTTSGRTTPVQVNDLSDVDVLRTGWAHSCALVDVIVRCWGWNSYGQLGNGHNDDEPARVDVVGLP